MIAIKIQTNHYVTLDDIENDLLLMISNARKYNDPKSQIYKVKKLFFNSNLWKYPPRNLIV